MATAAIVGGHGGGFSTAATEVIRAIFLRGFQTRQNARVGSLMAVQRAARTHPIASGLVAPAFARESCMKVSRVAAACGSLQPPATPCPSCNERSNGPAKTTRLFEPERALQRARADRPCTVCSSRCPLPAARRSPARRAKPRNETGVETDASAALAAVLQATADAAAAARPQSAALRRNR